MDRISIFFRKLFSNPDFLFNFPALLSEMHYEYMLDKREKYKDDKRLTKFGYKVFSQNDDDGIIAEILKRISIKKGYFVEFGVSDGLENNTLNLLIKGWKGAWIEGGKENHEKIKEKFKKPMEDGRLKVKNSFITAENILNLFEELEVPREFELLSIDIDGNDYWIWKILSDYRPKIVIIEYNATFRPDTEWVMKYDPDFIWKGTNYFGASLKSLEILGKDKGYNLVGCNFTGANAFFVREELTENKFCSPFTAENHYEPPRYYMNFCGGHKKDFGDFEAI